MRFLFQALVLSVAFAAGLVRAEPLTPIRIISLFNGTNLAGWHSWLVDSRFDDPRGVFSVNNGAIRISGDGLGYLGTTNTFRDYMPALEFRWARATRIGAVASAKPATRACSSMPPAPRATARMDAAYSWPRLSAIFSKAQREIFCSYAEPILPER